LPATPAFPYTTLFRSVAVVGWVVQQLKLRAGVASIDGTVVESAGSHWQAIKAEAARLAAAAAQQAARAAPQDEGLQAAAAAATVDRKSTRLNSSHVSI